MKLLLKQNSIKTIDTKKPRNFRGFFMYLIVRFIYHSLLALGFISRLAKSFSRYL